MELKVANGRVGTVEILFDDVDERPVDCDFMLPDYLPDIAAILKCRMKPMVQSHQISGDRVIADGTVYLQLLYVDEDRRCVRSYEYSQPFSSAFTVKNLKSSDVVRLSARANYVNCRATGPRRVDVHGAFGVHLCVISEGNTDVVTEAECIGLYTKVRIVEGSVPLENCEKTVSINEVLELGEREVQALTRCDAAAVVTECRQLAGKAIVKGDVLLEAVCVVDGENGELCRHTDRIPFSQILDMAQLAEDTPCEYTAAVTQCDMRVVQDPAGQNRLLSVAVKLNVTAQCYGTRSCTVITDAFHTGYPLKTEACRVEPRRLAFVKTDTVTVTLTQELPDSGIVEIVDLWCETPSAVCEAQGNDTYLRGKTTVCMIVRDNGGSLSYYERPAEYSVTLPEACDTVHAAITPLDVTYTQNGGKAELRLPLCISRVGMSTDGCAALTHIQVDETAPYTEDGVLAGCTLKICFAAGGESVWDIARRERTSPQAIKEDNGLTDDILPNDCMLLI